MAKESALLAALLLIGIAVLAFLTTQLSAVARLVPEFVVVPTLAMLSYEFAREIRHIWRPAAHQAERPASTSEHRVIPWVLLLPALFLLIGLVPAVLVFTFFYVHTWIRQPYWRSALIALCTAGAVWGMSSVAVNQRALEGWLWNALGVLQ